MFYLHLPIHRCTLVSFFIYESNLKSKRDREELVIKCTKEKQACAVVQPQRRHPTRDKTSRQMKKEDKDMQVQKQKGRKFHDTQLYAQAPKRSKLHKEGNMSERESHN